MEVLRNEICGQEAARMPGDPCVGAACGWIPDSLSLPSATTSIQAQRPPMDSSVRRLAHLAGPLCSGTVSLLFCIFPCKPLCVGGHSGPRASMSVPPGHPLFTWSLPSLYWPVCPLYSHPESAAKDVCVVGAPGQASYLALRAGPQPSQEHHSQAPQGWLAL